MDIQVKSVWVTIVLLNWVDAIRASTKIQTYSIMSSRESLREKNCTLYTVPEEIMSSVMCASTCTAIHVCTHYEYNYKPQFCLICVHGDDTRDLVGHSVFKQHVVPTAEIYEKTDLTPPQSCSDITTPQSGVYTIYPSDGSTRQVYCDKETSRGGWTLFQRRRIGDVAFNHTWQGYKDGFGDVNGDFWLGNELLSIMTAGPRKYRLRFDLWSFSSGMAYAEYENFNVGNEASNYKLTFTAGSYSGTANDYSNKGLSFHNGMEFTTIDRDNDNRGGSNCAQNLADGGFWYNNCDVVNPSAEFRHTVAYGDGYLQWEAWVGKESLKGTEIKFRPMEF